MTDRAASAGNRSLEFQAPEVEIGIRTAPAWCFFALVFFAASVSSVFLEGQATWSTPMPLFTALSLGVLAAIAGLFGAFRTVDGLSEYASLAMPIGFAMLLLLDWRYFVLAIVTSELLTFVQEAVRGVNPTKWYIRIFNACMQIVCGAAATIVLRELHPIVIAHGHGRWFDANSALTLVIAGAAWKMLDNAQSSTLIALALQRPFSKIRVSLRTFLSQFALFLIAIPFARLWYENVWMSLFALAPLGVAYRLLGLPELEYRVRTDERTGLTNAVAFDRVLESALDRARESGYGVALLAIDIDFFKLVNDTYGHLAGDAVIAQFADVLGEVVRRDDVAARTGGEEFAILMRDGDRPGAVAFAERIRGLIEHEAFHADGIELALHLTASIGVALFPDDARTPRELRAAADTALYAAKRRGRNIVVQAA